MSDLTPEELEILKKLGISQDGLKKMKAATAPKKARVLVLLDEYVIEHAHICTLCGSVESKYFIMQNEIVDGNPLLQSKPIEKEEYKSSDKPHHLKESTRQVCKNCESFLLRQPIEVLVEMILKKQRMI